MGVNLMVEQSCNVILKSYTGVVNKIMINKGGSSYENK